MRAKKLITLVLLFSLIIGILPIQSSAEQLTPAELGWNSDSDDFSGWTVNSDGEISVIRQEAVNERIWKDLIDDRGNFLVSLDIKNDKLSSTYVKLFGVILELDSTGGDGNQTFVKLDGTNYDWVSGENCRFHVEVNRTGGGDLEFAVTGEGEGSSFQKTVPVKENNDALELGLYRGSSVFYNIAVTNPSVDASASPWSLPAGWQENEDGSVSHLSGSGVASLKKNIDNSEGFSLSLDMTIDSCDWEMFSVVYKLAPVDTSLDQYFYMRVQRSHGNWCARMEFYDGTNWYELPCDEGAFGEWVKGLGDEVRICLEHTSGEKSFCIAVGPEYANIVGGEMYIPQMDSFLSADAYSLSIHTEYPDTDRFILSDLYISSLLPSDGGVFPEAGSYDVKESCYISGKLGDTITVAFRNDSVNILSGDFLLDYDGSKLCLDKVSSSLQALVSVSGEAGEEILSFAQTELTEDGVFLRAEFTLLADLEGELICALAKNLRDSNMNFTSSAHAYAMGVEGKAPEECGHDFALTDTLFPTCTEEGWESYTCSLCQEIKTVVLPPKGHSYEEEVLQPTCTEYGYTIHRCTGCGDNYTDAETIPLGHTYELSEENEDECIYTCIHCGESYTEAKPQGNCPSEGFFDVPSEEHWAHEGIDFVIAKGLMNGVGSDSFAPEGTLTRAMLVTVLWRMEGLPAPVETASFTDVSDGLWYSQAVGWAAEQGIVKGMTQDQFAPDLSITREQIATIFYRYAKMKGLAWEAEGDLSAFADGAQVSGYAVEAVLWASAAEIIKGKADGALLYMAPLAYASRAETATILMRFCSLCEGPGDKGVVKGGIIYETTAANWTLPDTWTATTDAQGRIALTDSSGSGKEVYYRYTDKFSFEVPAAFTYDISFTSQMTHTIQLRDMNNSDGWASYLIRIYNNDGTLSVTGQLADNGWNELALAPEVNQPDISGESLRVCFERIDGADGIFLQLSDPVTGDILYRVILDAHVSRYQTGLCWFALSTDRPATISNITSDYFDQMDPPVSEDPLPPEAGRAYIVDEGDLNLGIGWTADTNVYGYLCLTGEADCSSEVTLNRTVNLLQEFSLIYDLTVPDGSSHVLWMRGMSNQSGSGVYLLCMKNHQGYLAVEGQFGGPDGWVNHVLTTEITAGTLAADRLRICVCEDATADGLNLVLTDLYTGEVVYMGSLSYHIGQWDCDTVTFSLSKEAGGNAVVMENISLQIPEEESPVVEGEFLESAERFGLGLGWSADCDADGNAVLICDQWASGAATMKDRADSSVPFRISYEVHFEPDELTTHAFYINGFRNSGYSGAYLIRVRNNKGVLSLEGQFNNGDWINNVLRTELINTALAGDHIRITVERRADSEGLYLLVTDLADNKIAYSGKLLFHEEGGWQGKQIWLSLWKEQGDPAMEIHRILLDIPEKEDLPVALKGLSIKEIGQTCVGLAQMFYASVEPYAADLEEISWTIEKDGVTETVGNYRALYHSFTEPGEYLLCVTATDQLGNTFQAEQMLTVLPAVEEESVAQLMGDTNGDGVINSTDAALVLQYLNGAGLRQDEILRALVSGGSTLSREDAVEILSLAGGEQGVSLQFEVSATDEFLSYMDEMKGIPVSFTYGEINYLGFGTDFAILSRETARENTATYITTTLLHADQLLQIKVEAVFYPLHNAYEWTVYFENVGDRNTPRLSDLKGANVCLKGENAVFKSIAGDKEDLYAPIEVDLSKTTRVIRRSVSGWTTHDGFPYFNLETDAGGYLMAIGWAGTWRAEFSYNKGLTHFIGGQYITDTYLMPGERFRTPLMAFVKYDVRDENVAINAWRNWYIDCNMPRDQDGSLIDPISTVCADANVEYGLMNSFLSESEAIDCISPMVENGIGVNYIWMDAGWHCYSDGGTLPEWFYIGTNTIDSNRLENGLANITNYGEENNMKALLWFEPEFIRMPLDGVVENMNYDPQWALYVEVDEHTRMNTYLNDLTNSDYQKWLLEHIAYILEHAGIECYRQDFNRSVGATWSAQDEEGRVGMYENQYIQAHYAYWDTLLRLFPELLIDCCASGGGRNDLECLRRGVIFHRTDEKNTDNEYTQAMSYSLWKWFPFTNSNNSTNASAVDRDTYALRTAYAPVFKGMNDFRYFDRNDNWDYAKEIFDEWSAVNWYYYGEYYPLTVWNRNTSQWIGWEFYDEQNDSAMVQLFRPADSGESTMHLVFYGLKTDMTYTVADTDGINSFTATGAELMEQGFTISIPNGRQALILMINPA